MIAIDRWLSRLCLGRVWMSLIFTAYSAVIPWVGEDWGISRAQAGSVQSAWHLGYLISLFVAGFLADRFGAKVTLLRMSIASALASILFACFANGYLSALILYGLAGLCSGGTYTPGLKLIYERSRQGSRGAAMGLYLASGSIGYALALLLAALVIPFAGWRAALILSALACFPGILWLRQGLRQVEETRLALDPPQGREGWSDLLVNRAAIACILAYSFHCWELLGLWAWLPSFVVESGPTGSGAGIGYGLGLAALAHLVSSLGSLLGGRLADSLGSPLVMLLMSLASLSCSFSLGWLVEGPAAVVFVMVLLYNLFAIGDSAVYSAAVAEVVPGHRLGAAYSIRSVLGFGAGAISPWVFGLVLDWARATELSPGTAWGLAWSSLGLGALPGLVMILWFRRLLQSRS